MHKVISTALFVLVTSGVIACGVMRGVEQVMTHVAEVLR